VKSKVNVQRERKEYPLSTKTDNTLGTCHISIGSVTAAMRGQKILRNAGVASSLVKNDTGKHNGGCVYGLTVPCLLLKNARRILQENGVKEINQEYDQHR
jgi:hypothetical protein